MAAFFVSLCPLCLFIWPHWHLARLLIRGGGFSCPLCLIALALLQRGAANASSLLCMAFVWDACHVGARPPLMWSDTLERLDTFATDERQQGTRSIACHLGTAADNIIWP